MVTPVQKGVSLFLCVSYLKDCEKGLHKGVKVLRRQSLLKVESKKGAYIHTFMQRERRTVRRKTKISHGEGEKKETI